MLKRDQWTVAKLTAQVDNPSVSNAYGAVTDRTDEPYYDILLITTAGMVADWEEYIDWRTKCGYYIAVETVQEIYTNYTGVDNPEKIRNCIIDYYDDYDLIYVFLAGDDEFLPHRGLYDASGYVDDDIAGDCYFAGLDGNWNLDGDELWGEPNEADLRAEVFVSRAAVDSPTEIDNFVNKQMMFERQPVVSEVETALMTGEDLGWPIWGWEYKEEIRTGSSSWGFLTAPFPPNFEVRTLYDYPGQSWSGLGNLAPLLNQGPIYVNHLGHCNTDYMMKLYDYQITTTNFTNNGVNHNFYVIYSQGCYCGSFDNRTTGGSYTVDCITEVFSVLSNSAVALETNSRYGWGDLTTTQGSSQYYDKQFFDAIWGEAITVASETNIDSKEDCIPYIEYNQNRWCFYELNLFSEPVLDMWTAEPTTMTVNYTGAILLGSTSFQVQVLGLEGARVCFSMDGVIYGVGFTDASGNCTLIFDNPILTLGTADLYVIAHDRLPYEGTVLVIPPSGPYVIYAEATINDLIGNNNGQWDYGETTNINLTVENVGVAIAPNVIVNISTLDTLIGITGQNVNFGTINQGATSTVNNAFTISAEGVVEDGHMANFTLVAQSDTNLWNSYFSLVINAPKMEFSELEVDDISGGNGNGNLDPGETATLLVTLSNEGGCYTTGLDAILSESDPYVTITSANWAYGTIPSGGTGVGNFTVSVSSTCPQEHAVDFAISLADDIGYADETAFSTVVGDITYDPTGPDSYGYSAYDPNDAPEFPEYEWIEICPDSGGVGIEVPFVNDDQVFSYPLPFTFQYYGQDFDTVTIASNGWVGMGRITEEDYSNSAIPNPDGPAGMIAAYWEDLSPQRDNSGGVWYYYDAVNHLYIVEYNHIEQFLPVGSFETFEAILYDPAYYNTSTGDGRIKVQYKDMSSAVATEGTVGIENPAETIGLQYLFDGDLDEHAMMVGDQMAILYSTEINVPSMTVVLTPTSYPIVIPPGGGSFSYQAQISNTGTEPVIFDVWAVITLPSGSEFQLFNRNDINLNAGASLSRTLTQSIPGNAPAGLYTYHMYVGNYQSGAVWAEDDFEFTKSGQDNSAGGNWDLQGWDIPEAVTAAVPEEFALYQNYPNPFNPVTFIHYELPEGSLVKLSVFNTLGQEVAVLVNGFQTAGFKTVALDASGWSSGIYFYKLQAGEFSDMKKMVLLK
jgi:hypothetical protein